MKQASAILAVVSLLSVASSSSAAPAQPPEFLVDIQVFRVQGNFSGDLSLTQNIWAEPSGPSKGIAPHFTDLTVFTRAKIQVADRQLLADDKGWHWNGGKEFPPGNADSQETTGSQQVVLVAEPKVAVPEGSDATVMLSSEQTIQYFERLRDDTFQLKALQQPTGLTFRMRLERKGPDQVLLRKFKIESRLIEKREPIAGVALDVGAPVVKSRDFEVSMVLRIGEDYGLLLHGEGVQGLLLIRLRVSAEPEANISGSSVPAGPQS